MIILLFTNGLLFNFNLIQFHFILFLKLLIKGIFGYYGIHLYGIDHHVFVEYRLYSFVIFLHYPFILQFIAALFDALHVCVHYFAIFLAIAVLHLVFPSATVEFQVEIEDVYG